jgi:hypothetical protein
MASMQIKACLAGLALISTSLACALPVGPQEDTLATSVAATLTAAAVSLPTDEAATPGPTTVSVSGAVCYPSEDIPAMTAYFQETESGATTAIPISAGQDVYGLQLPPGTYVAFAWTAEGALGGSYSRAVPCGLSATCTDHSLIPFQVLAGEAVIGIDLCDWYGMPGDVPPPPGQALAPTATPPAAASPTSPPPPGGVSLNCDGTYQRLRLTDGGAAGKTVSVDNWDGSGWVNVWNLAGGDPMIRQIEDQAGYYEFGGCQKLVIVPLRYTGSGAVLELTVYAWNGSGLTQVYGHDGVHGDWQKAGARITFSESLYLFGEPTCCPCNQQHLEHTWNGTAFIQTGSLITPTGICTPVP